MSVVPEGLDDEPAAIKLVAMALAAADEPLRGATLIERLHLSDSTVYRALRALEDGGRVARRPDLEDGRKYRYQWLD